jgi:hypothetical protein
LCFPSASLVSLRFEAPVCSHIGPERVRKTTVVKGRKLAHRYWPTKGSNIQIAQQTIGGMEAIRNPAIKRFLRLRSRKCTLAMDEPIRKQMARIIHHVRLMRFSPIFELWKPENGTIGVAHSQIYMFAIVTHNSPHFVGNALEPLDLAPPLHKLRLAH